MAAKALIVLGLAACAVGSYNAGYSYSYAPQNYGYGYTIGSHGYHKREAEPSYSPALAYHPAGGYGYNKYGPGYSYTDRSPQGLRVHKRSPQLGALALVGGGLLGAGLAGAYEPKYRDIHYRNSLRYYKREAEPSYAPALAYHPAGGYGYNKYGPGYSYTDRSPQGLHKREAEPSYAPALAYHPAGGYGYNKYGPGYSYTDRSPQGLRVHKRSPQLLTTSALTLLGAELLGVGLAGQSGLLGGRRGKREAEPSYAPALAYHPAGGYGYNKYGPGYSYTDRSPQGLRVHKRSPQLLTTSALTLLGAQALGWGLAGQTGLLGGRRFKREAEPSYAPALAYHPAGGYGYNKYGPGYSYTDRSPQGIHKREAEPSYAPALAYHPAGGYGYNKYGPGYSYTDRSPQGLHKREASGNSYQSLVRTDCHGYNCQNTEYGVNVNGYNAHVYENREGH